jgi:hypothetical protein
MVVATAFLHCLLRPDGWKYTRKPFPFRSPEGRVALMIKFEKARYTKLPLEYTPPK